MAASFSSWSGGFSGKRVEKRIMAEGGMGRFTADGQFRGGKEIPLKPVVDEALAMGGCEAIKTVFVYKRSGSKVPMSAGRDLWWGDALKGHPHTSEPNVVNAAHPLFTLSPSGYTANPQC